MAAQHNVNDDYVGGQWINGEYFYESKVEKDVQSREDAIYGIFSQGMASKAQPSSSRRKQNGRSKDIFGGIAFISSGVIKGSKDKEREEREKEAKKKAKAQAKAALADDLDDERPMLGSGSRPGLGASSRPGLGSGSNSSSRPGLGAQSESAPPATASRFATKAKARAKRKKVEKVDKDFGTFEKHGNSFASKMLAKWGFDKTKGIS